jgi:hypothetical protein
MRILLDAHGERATLQDPDDFRAFSVVAAGPADAGRLATAAAPVGRADGTTHVFVEPFALVALAGERGHDAGWLSSLSDMTAYAHERGWVDDRGAVRAHVDWTAP